MKVCESWLRDWVDYDLPPEELAQALTMLGLEVESLTPVAPPSSGVVVGEVLEQRPHPNAERLRLCRVSVGTAILDIVCGAANVRPGGRYPTALVGATLPGEVTIRPVRIRGEPSAGMLCSARELGLDHPSEGLLELPAEAPPGSDVRKLLLLDDRVIELNITPNRADCLSIAGLAREVALVGGRLRPVRDAAVPATAPDQLGVKVLDAADCPRFVGRVIRNIRPGVQSPLWLTERLRRCGVRPLHPVVDITNYVMLELGQPMHAYDLAQLRGEIHVRRARAGERLALLDGREIELDGDLLVIADEQRPVALAGIMGGAATAVSTHSRDVFLESAFFSPAVIAGRARRFGLHTDASLRFERGVDPTQQCRAMERATELITEIAGGQPGPVSEALGEEHLPRRTPVRLRRSRLQRVLGAAVPDQEVQDILQRLNMKVTGGGDGWLVQAPPARFDIEREEDLIEEVARVYGYHRIPEQAGSTVATLGVASESRVPVKRIRALLGARGYAEAINYSFVDPAIDTLFAGGSPGLVLANPISAEMAAMRQSLWPGLVQAVARNLNRQRGRIRLYEAGVIFVRQGNDIKEVNVLAGAVTGDRMPEQWGHPSAAADLFDVKGDVEALLALTGAPPTEFRFVRGHHPALHPGRTAQVLRGETPIGWLGELHPALGTGLELVAAPIMFELAIEAAFSARCPVYQEISRFPEVRRDIAVVVGRDIPVAALTQVVREAAPAVLRDVTIFDIYMGPQVGQSEKSVAIGLILQDASRTLTDGDVDQFIQSVIAALRGEFGARIRE